MKIKLDKMKLNAIETAFAVLKQDPYNKASCVIISKSLKDCFGCDFFVTVVDPKTPNSPLFVMSVYPTISTITKIVDALGNDKELEAISNIWKDNNSWVIEIDSRILYTENSTNKIFDSEPTAKELTAALMHEVGHIAVSNSIPVKITTIMRYELAKSSVVTKAMLRDGVFKPLMALPVLDSCVTGAPANKKALKEEIKADTFAKKMGYSNDLISFLDKVSKYASKNKNIYSKDESMKKMTQYVVGNLEDFQSRKDRLTKNGLVSLKESCDSPYVEKVINDYIDTVYNDSTFSINVINGKKLEIMHERADKDTDEYFSEFAIFPSKKLKRIDPAELDYIFLKIPEIRNDSDKMMLISYVHNKIDLVDYYISIKDSGSTRYTVPHTKSQLDDIRSKLLEAREKIMNYRIPERNRHILVKWPTGYEG